MTVCFVLAACIVLLIFNFCHFNCRMSRCGLYLWKMRSASFQVVFRGSCFTYTCCLGVLVEELRTLLLCHLPCSVLEIHKCCSQNPAMSTAWSEKGKIPCHTQSAYERWSVGCSTPLSHTRGLGEDSWFLKGKQPTCEVILLYPEISSPPSWEKPKVSPDMDIGQKCLRARDIIKEVIHKCHLPTSSCTHSPYPYLYPTLLFLPETVGYPDVLEVDYRIIS